MPDDNSVTVNKNLIQLLSNNPATPLTPANFQAAAKGDLVAVSGCIERLMYLKDGNDLFFVTVGGTTVPASQATNLNDFRDRLQEAANFGHGVVFCWFKGERRINMLHVIPCQCTCDKRD